MLTVILLMIFIAVALLFHVTMPFIVARTTKVSQQQTQTMLNKFDTYLQDDQIKRARQLMLFGPIMLGLAGLILFPDEARPIGLVVGLFLGFAIPKMYVNKLIADRKAKFNDQLMDALMIMSSSFRGGLSLTQAIEALVDEMPDPAKAEFGIVLGENKMGVALDESLGRLYKRMPSAAMQQVITAIILARETGGNLPVIFSRIIGTIRERKKIEQNLQTLTIQGKIQAVVMSGLPIVFVVGVSASNPHFFDVMLHTAQGQKLVILCAILWVVGALSIWKISTFKDL